ncbi:MAG: GspE/PulE family protein [Geminicoccaceae bacterium]
MTVVSAPAPPAIFDLGDPRLDALFAELIASGAADEQDLLRAVKASRQTDGRADLALISLGILSEERLAEAWAGALGWPYLSGSDLLEELVMPAAIKLGFLRRGGMCILPGDDGTNLLVVSDPLNETAITSVRFALAEQMAMAIAAPSTIERALKAVEDPLTAVAPVERDHEDDVARLRDQASDAPVIRWVDRLIADAVERGASDIHLEPEDRQVGLRLRVDGRLQALEPVTPSMAAAATSRIKILGRLDIAERRLPQDGRCSVNVRGRPIDLRIATAPTSHGEAVVLRILDKNRALLDLEALGYTAEAQACARALLTKPNGIILVTGPTGAGKTTTLYAALDQLRGSDRKLISVEDPIEYELTGISQIQAQPGIGLTFAAALRSILRHDPDIVMVGEIRDRETAEVAIEAALTGHLVLSTLHTNNAAAALTRLAEMGLPAYLLAAAMRGIIAQRLLRRVCRNCVTPAPPGEALAERLGLDQTAGFSTGSGCRSCQRTGFRGRIAAAEILEVTEAIQSLVLAGASEMRIRQAAVDDGMVPLFGDALAKAQAGLTTIEEALTLAERI